MACFMRLICLTLIFYKESEKLTEDPEIFSFLARIIPVTKTFNFQSPEEFEAKANKAVLVQHGRIF